MVMAKFLCHATANVNFYLEKKILIENITFTTVVLAYMFYSKTLLKMGFLLNILSYEPSLPFKSGSVTFEHLWSPSCTKSEKANEPILRKVRHSLTDLQTDLQTD